MNYECYIFSTGMLSTNPAIYSGYYAGSDAESFHDPHQYNHLDLEGLRHQKRPHHVPEYEKPSSWETDDSGKVHHVYHGYIREIDEISTDEELDTSYHDMLSEEDQDNFAHILTDPLPSHTTPPPTPILDPGMARLRWSQRQVSFWEHDGITMENPEYSSDKQISSPTSYLHPHTSRGSFSSRITDNVSATSPGPPGPLYGYLYQEYATSAHLAENSYCEENSQRGEENTLESTTYDANHTTTRGSQGGTPGIPRRQVFAQILNQSPIPILAHTTTRVKTEDAETTVASSPQLTGLPFNRCHASVEEEDEDVRSTTEKPGMSDIRRLLPQSTHSRPSSTSPRLPTPAPRPSTPVLKVGGLPEIRRHSPSPNRGGTYAHNEAHSTRRSSKKERPPHASNHTAWYALTLVNDAIQDLAPLDIQYLEGGLCAIQGSLHRQRSITHEQWVAHSFEWYEKYKERVRSIEALVSWVRESVSKLKSGQALSGTLLERFSSVGTLLFDIASKLHASFDRLERRYKHILEATLYPPPHQMRAKIRAGRLAAIHAQARYEADLLSTII